MVIFRYVVRVNKERAGRGDNLLRIQNSELRTQNSELRIQDSELRIQN
ncbi:hypothetical protein [Nostoc sp.]